MTERQVTPARRALRLIAVNLLLVIAYLLSGWLGYFMLVPGQFSSVVWLPAGVALATVLLLGPACLPGVFIGSLAMSLIVTGSIEHLLTEQLIILSILGAIGATCQAAFGRWAAIRSFGAPFVLENGRQVLWLTTLLGPLTACISVSIGLTGVALFGAPPHFSWLDGWVAWWLGDLLGIAVVVPLALFLPWRETSFVTWRGFNLTRMSPGALACVLLCIGCSFYAWATISILQQDRGRESFNALVDDTVRLFEHRLQSYGQLLDGGAGLIAGSGQVDRDEWRDLVHELNFRTSLPGILGIGLILPVDDKDLPDFIAKVSAQDGMPLEVHPKVEAPEHYIVRFIEPLEENGSALGLDLAFSTERRDALNLSRQTGHMTLSAPLRLVQSHKDGAGFVLMRPIYHHPSAATDGRSRMGSIAGWVYAPFLADTFFGDMIGLSNPGFEVSIADLAPEGELPIYATPRDDGSHVPHFRASRVVNVYERNWQLDFTSTPAFEDRSSRFEPFLVLLAGLTLSGVIGIQLTMIARRAEIVRRMVDEKTRELATQEEHTRSIIDTAMVGIMLLDSEGRVLAQNRAVIAIFGLQPGDLIGRHLSDLLDEEALDLAAQQGPGGQMPRRLSSLRADGSEVFVELQLNAWRTEGDELRYTAILRDVTFRERAERHLRENEQRWKLALTGARIAVFDRDVETGHQLVSDTWLQLMGLPEEMAGRTDLLRDDWESRIHPADLERVLQADEACIAGMTERSVKEYRVQLPDGSWRWMRSEAIVPERDETGRARRLLGVQSDVTELKTALEALRQSEAQFRSTLDLAPVGMALLDEDCQLTQVNAALVRFTGFSEAELLSMTLANLTPPGPRVIDADARAALRSGELRVVQLERQFLRKDGSEASGLVHISLRHLGDGVAPSFIVQVQDITELRRMEQMKSNFVATVSHELRTPLTSIKGALGLVLGSMGSDVPAKAERLLSIAAKNCDRLVMLVNDILDMEKISSGQARFSMVDTGLLPQLEQAVAVNQPYARDLGVRFELAFDCDPVWVRVDIDRLQQVMSNLMSNAAKYSPRGEVVTIGGSCGDGQARVTVTDRGAGVPEAFFEQIFTPFSQADASVTREKGGTGLGLNITRKIVERFGGQIGFRNLEGGGCEFWFTLPLQEAGTETETRLGPADPGLMQAPPVILHIEDDRDFAEIFRSMIGDRAEVVWAGSMAKARLAIADRPYDLVVIDWGLPDGSGEGLLDALRLGQSEARVFGLSARENTVEDPRVIRNLVKSRLHLEQIIGELLQSVVHHRREGATADQAET